MASGADGLPTLNHNYATRQNDNVAPPFQRLTSGQHSALFVGADIWNNLPLAIKCCETLPKFKKLAREFVRQNYS
jgi:hypothetical protein